LSKVQKLPEHLIRLIAAGEVIERPASVVKELVENSLDAGATAISLDIWGAGRTRLRISDNGSGMTKDDALLALERHATSKLKSFDDLYALDTFGFRGEALPSIASVSRLTITTRTADEPGGWELQLEGGKLLSTKEVGCPVGTTIDVQDLFFNTPARDKFLKRDGTEKTHILRVIQELSLANIGVRFEVSVDGKNSLLLPAAKELGGRLADLWGIEIAQRLKPVLTEQGPCTIRGMVNDVPGHHPTKAYQSLFINGRPVQHRMVSHAIYEAYHEWLPVGRHPVYALFIDLDPKMLDVNVHPAKREVRIAEERPLYDAVFKSIRSLFRPLEPQAESTAAASTPFSNSTYTIVPAPTRQESLEAFVAQSPLLATAVLTDRVSDQVSPAYTGTPMNAPASVLLKQGYRYLGIFRKLFILVEQGEDLLIIDQHAAAERILYEKFLKQAHVPTLHRQPLLTPYLWELQPAQAVTVQNALPMLNDMGFALESFGGSSFALKEWPAELSELKDARRFLDLLLDALEKEAPGAGDEPHHEAVARAACRAAIKANDTIAAQEVDHLLKELASCERPMTCPHGRPTHLRLSTTEFFRRFGRT